MSGKVKTIIFIVLLAVLIMTIFVGIKFLDIPSISEMNLKNQELNSKIEIASKLTAIDYPNESKKLENSFENFSVQKAKYEELSAFSGKKDKGIYETKQYDISYLWKTVGKYANKYNLTISMNVKKTTGENLYDLNFAVSGSYVNTSEFIAAIENDSQLYFRVYNFRMTGSSETVGTTFIVRDVNIDPSTITAENTELSTTEQ